MRWVPVLALLLGAAQAQVLYSISGCTDRVLQAANPLAAPPVDLKASTYYCPTNVPVTFTITGSNLGSSGSVTIGGRPCTVTGTNWTPTQIICTFAAVDVQQSVPELAGPFTQQFVVVASGSSRAQDIQVYAAFTTVVFTSLGRANAGPARKADPCNNGTITQPLAGRLDGTTFQDCADPRPISSSTLYLPSLDSITSNSLTQLASAAGITLTVTGMNFPTAVPAAAIGNLRLGTSSSCANAAGTPWAFTTTTRSLGTFAIFAADIALLTETPLFLCFFPFQPGTTNPSTQGRWTGLALARTWDCDSTVTTKACSQRPVDATLPISTQMQLRARTTCCRATNAVDAIGVCINPNTTACCGATTYTVGSERCCNPNTVTTNEVVTRYTQPCPCTWTGATNPLVCPTGEQCCLPTKYPELTGSADANVQSLTTSQCYNPATMQCCNTGKIYDPGSQQCCAINGLQSVDVPCPCGQDSDCQLGGRSNFACCMQTSPPLQQAILNPTISGYTQPMCNSYQSYPTGQADPATQRCPGTCINVDYQICCNGVACIHAFEKCCNATCCNQFTGSCNRAIVPGTGGAQGNQWNPNEFRVTYLKCSTIEHMHELKAFWIFVWPTYLLLMTLASLALVIIFANKASSRNYSVLEQTIIASALLATIFSLSLFFSPVYKYGMVVIFAHLLAILTAGVRVRSLNLLTVIVFAITVIYLFDPFHGNAYLTLAENRHVDGYQVNGVNVAGTIDRETMGIWHSTFRIWKTLDMTLNERYCTNYYNYFLLDDNLRDLQRFDNPLDTTWGYCNRGWVFALLMFEGFIILFTILNFFLTIIGLLVRFSETAKPEAFPALQDIPY